MKSGARECVEGRRKRRKEEKETEGETILRWKENTEKEKQSGKIKSEGEEREGGIFGDGEE